MKWYLRGHGPEMEKTLPTEMVKPLNGATGRMILRLIDDTLQKEPNVRPTARDICNQLENLFGYSESVGRTEMTSYVRGDRLNMGQAPLSSSPSIYFVQTIT